MRDRVFSLLKFGLTRDPHHRLVLAFSFPPSPTVHVIEALLSQSARLQAGTELEEGKLRMILGGLHEWAFFSAGPGHCVTYSNIMPKMIVVEAQS